MRARFYDFETGRFITKDPVEGTLKNPQTFNAYAYSLNNLVNFSYPSGKTAAGICASLNLGLGVYGTCSFCIVGTSKKEVGVVFSAGGGGTTGIASGIGAQGLYSTANNLKDLKGVDVFGGVSAWAVGVDVSVDKDNPHVKTTTAGPSFGPDYSPPFIPGEFHGGATHSWIQSVLQF